MKQQITDIVLVSNERDIEIAPEEYTKNVYAIIFVFFENLKHLSIVSSSTNVYPPWSLYSLPPMTCSSSTLTKLCIDVPYFFHLLPLLDGRLKQLTTLIVRIGHINNIFPSENKVCLREV